MKDLLVAAILFVCFNTIYAEHKKEFKIHISSTTIAKSTNKDTESNIIKRLIIKSSNVNLCYRDDPKVAECLMKEIQKLVPLFKNGSEEFNMERLDPIYFDIIPLKYKSGIIRGSLNITDIYIHGLSTSIIKDVRPDLSKSTKLKLTVDVYLPFLNVKTDYSLKGNVIRIPVDAKGRVDMLFESLNISYHMTGDVKTIDDNEYLIIDELTWKFFSDGIRKAHVQNKDLVDGRPALNRFLRTVVNSNWKLLIKQMLPVIIPESDKKLLMIFKKFFKTLPFDIIFPQKIKD